MTEKQKNVSVKLWLGIFFLPFIFVWFTLKPGYSKLARFMSLFWLALFAWSFFANYQPESQKDREWTERKREMEAELAQHESAYKEGQNFQVGYTSYRVLKSWWSDRSSKNQYLNQKPNAMFLFVELIVRNDDKKARTVPPFKLIDQNGAEYESSSAAFAAEGAMGMLESLNPGVQKQGFILFDVPKKSDYYLLVSGGYWSSDEARVRLAPE